jgi:hypothetical protein
LSGFLLTVTRGEEAAAAVAGGLSDFIRRYEGFTGSCRGFRMPSKPDRFPSVFDGTAESADEKMYQSAQADPELRT